MGDCQSWTHIKKLFEGEDHIAGLKKDGTLIAAGYDGYNQLDVSGFSNIVDGIAMNQTTFAVDFNGEVYTIGENFAGEDNVSGWTNIVAIVAGDEHTVGLRSDGTVVMLETINTGKAVSVIGRTLYRYVPGSSILLG